MYLYLNEILSVHVEIWTVPACRCTSLVYCRHDPFTSSSSQYSLTLFRNLSNEAVVDSGVCRVVDEEVEVLLPSDANASSNNVREIGDDKHVKDRRVDLQCLDMHGSLLFRLLFLPSALLCCRRSRCSLTDVQRWLVVPAV